MRKRVLNGLQAVRVGFRMHDVQNYRYLIALFIAIFWITVIGLITYGLVGIYQAIILGFLLSLRGVLLILVESLRDGKIELEKETVQ